MAALSPGRGTPATTQEECEGRSPGGVEKRKPTPGRVLRGARHGVGSFLLTQTTTNCPRVDLEELS
ncbi:MAG: hypothetical protein WCD04_08305, partial [Terriglobia bacterium]